MKLKTAAANGGWFFRLMSFLSKNSRTLLAGAVSAAVAWQGLFFLIRLWAVWEKGGLYLTTRGGGIPPMQFGGSSTVTPSIQPRMKLLTS